MARKKKRPVFGVNTYIKKTKKKLKRHKKRMNKAEKRNYKKSRGQGRRKRII
jgi:methylmalonyl-CoA mutase N-terminal domain/subunit